jgi:hypothetical protein
MDQPPDRRAGKAPRAGYCPRRTDGPTEDDYDHTGHERKVDVPGGSRGGGDPNSTLGR